MIAGAREKAPRRGLQPWRGGVHTPVRPGLGSSKPAGCCSFWEPESVSGANPAHRRLVLELDTPRKESGSRSPAMGLQGLHFGSRRDTLSPGLLGSAVFLPEGSQVLPGAFCQHFPGAAGMSRCSRISAVIGSNMQLPKAAPKIFVDVSSRGGARVV